MKFSCNCGEKIYDSSDFLSYKASLISDQDLEDFAEQSAGDLSQAFDAISEYGRTIYQCQNCGRLIFDLGERLLFFKPEAQNCPVNLLRSVEGEQWKRHLRARWLAGRGEVWWGFGVTDEGFVDELSSKEEVEKLYFEVFDRLSRLDTLRNSFLDIDGETIHRWPKP